jgi:ABC-2 type transport system permease protein
LELGARTFSFLVYASMGMALGTGAGVAAYFLVAGGEMRLFPVLFWVLAFIWQMVPVMLASFQEQFDLGILLRFPVRFGSYVLLYLVFGLWDISTILGGLCCLGIWFGIAAARPTLLLWATLVLALFAAFNILLVRAIFAWIERWLAQRKTREILGAVFMVAILAVQFLNPAIYGAKHGGRHGPPDPSAQLSAVKARYAPYLRQAEEIQSWLPPGLAARALVLETEQGPAWGSLGLLGIDSLVAFGVLALRLKSEYRGENLSVAPRRANPLQKPGKSLPSSEFVPAQLGEGYRQSLPATVAVVIEKEVRSLLRTLPLLYSIGAPLLLVLVFSTVFLKGGAAQASAFRLSLPLCLVYAQLGFTQILYNNLGAEGPAIQLYFLSPTPIRDIMLAKNLLHSVLFILVALLAGILSTLRLGVSDGAVIAATSAWLVFSLAANLTAGNIFSIKMAYRINPGRISRQRGSQANSLLSLLVQLGLLSVGAVVFAASWYVQRIWIAVPVFLCMAVAAGMVYLRGLRQVDAMANAARDKLIATLMKAV